MENQPKTTHKAGMATAISLVIGNTIASGVFLLPSTLAPYGGISLFGWLFSTLGALSIAFVFAGLSRRFPAEGGPYAYSRMAFGDFIGFQIAWGYWISVWVGNAAIVTSAVSYLSVFFPALNDTPALGVFTGLGLIWILSGINNLGIRESSWVQRVTTVLKLLPLLLIPLFGMFYIQAEHFIPFNPSGKSAFAAISTTAALTLWAFVGIESATVPANYIHNPERTIPRATIWGTLIIALIYIGGSTVIMGLIPPDQLAKSTAPYADAAEMLWGQPGRYLVALGAIIASTGALNGWILIQGQLPMAAAADNLFPALFAKTNRRGAPSYGILLSSILVSILMGMNYSRGLVNTFQFMLLLATITVLIPYLFCAAAYVAMSLRRDKRGKIARPGWPVLLGFLAFFYSLWAIAGSGQEAVYWGFLLLLAGTPVFLLLNRRRTESTEE
ncbi:MAG: amino acid permease [Haliscomenobacter sp.]|nr:amino acid permease [Haliscomenobacter sp.]